MPDRTVLVAPERLPGWIERFGGRHGEVAVDRDASAVTLTAADGAVATYDDTPAPDPFGLVLVRRGGYAVGLVESQKIAASKCGTRYVQGKAKAGGWSQQRYARRRANQADGLARACGAVVDRVLGDRPGLIVFCGGDRELVKDALATSRTVLMTAERWLDVREPRYAVLQEAVGQARAVEVRLNPLA